MAGRTERPDRRPGGDNRGSDRGGDNRGGDRGGDNRGGDGRRGGGRRGRRGERPEREEREQLDERVVDIVRTAKVVKGGRRFAFRACVVVGDHKGRVGVGIGKAREVPDAIRKAGERARKAMIVVPMLGATIPHEVQAQFGAGEVLLKPANPGTGVIAGRGVRPVIEAAGINDILSKSLGSTNVLNVVQATFTALQELKDFRREAQNRGVDMHQLAPFWYKEETHG